MDMRSAWEDGRKQISHGPHEYYAYGDLDRNPQGLLKICDEDSTIEEEDTYFDGSPT